MELQCPIENDRSDTNRKKQKIKHLPSENKKSKKATVVEQHTLSNLYKRPFLPITRIALS
jgi:hypothetical protein